MSTFVNRRLAPAVFVFCNLGVPVLAQAAAPTESADTPAPEAATADPGTSDSGALGEVVVTAQRRLENAQKTPIAIDTVSAAQLTNAGAVDPSGLTTLVPSAQIGKAAGPYYVFFLRGVGSNATNSLTEPAVSLSLDGVPLARQYNTDGQFYDLQRVEILEGPQGTLYGRNATGGAINLIPQRPTHAYSADVDASTGNYGLLQSTAAVNVPLNDWIAARVSGQSVSHSGYLSDDEADDDTKSGRLQAVFDPSDALSILLSSDLVNQNGRGGGSALCSAGYAVDQRIGLGDPLVQAIEQQRGLSVIQASQLYQNNRYYGFKGELNWTTDLGTLTVVPAYRHASLNFAAMFGGLETDWETDKQKSLETRFASKQMGIVHWVAGALYLDDIVDANFNINNLNRTGSQQIYDTGTRSYAAFADATADLTSQLRLIGGARYTRDRKSIDGSLHNPFVANPVYIRLDDATTYDKVTWRGGLQYDVTDSSMVYATVSTGFRAGGYFWTADNPVFKPETMTAYTLGAKNRFLDNRLQANVEIFEWKYKDQQLSHTIIDTAGDSILAVSNAGSTTIRGVELDLKYRAGATQFGLDVQYLDSVIDEFSYLQLAKVGVGSTCSGTPAPGGYIIDCAGSSPTESPRWVMNPSVEHSFLLPNGGGLTANLSSHFQTMSYTALNFVPSDIQGSYWSTNALLTYHASDDKWSVGLFGENLSNKAIKQFTTHTNFDASQLLPPRTYGLRASFHFR
jgi:iron complex outermembrane recepter protein